MLDNNIVSRGNAAWNSEEFLWQSEMPFGALTLASAP